MRRSRIRIEVLLRGIAIVSLFLLSIQNLIITNVSEEADLEKLSFLSPNQDEKAKSLCSASEISIGKWRPREYERLPYLPKQIKKKQCYTELIQPWKTYEWIPMHNSKIVCQFPDFSPHAFCQVAKQKTILFVGDSLMGEHVSSLLHVMGLSFFDEDMYGRDGGKEYFSYRICSNSTSIIFRRNNWLRKVDEYLRDVNPDILIINQGAWFIPSEEKFQSKVEGLAHILQEWEKPIHVIWKTTAPGHLHCERFDKPVASISEMQYVTNRSSYPEKLLKHGWFAFQERNQLAIHILRSKNLPNLDIMDVYSVNILRPDEHVITQDGIVDCLHNCQPGSKTLVLNQWLQQLIALRQLYGNTHPQHLHPPPSS